MLDLIGLIGFGEGGWGGALLLGAFVTLTLSLCCAPFGFALGLLVAIGARSQRKLPQAAATVFSTVFRGLPELLTLLLVYYGAQITIQNIMIRLGVPGQFGINAFVAAVFAFSLVLAAFSSEVWLAAFKTIPRGQWEAAAALRLSRPVTFQRVILPQLLRIALPGLSNNWLTLLKDTSLVSTIALIDLMRQTNLAVAATKQPLVFYLAACVLYLLMSALSGMVFSHAERRYGRHFREAR